MQAFCWILTILGALAAMVQMGFLYLEGSSPKQGARAAIALCFAVVPYVLARAVGELQQLSESQSGSSTNKRGGEAEVLSELEEVEQWLTEDSSPSEQ